MNNIADINAKKLASIAGYRLKRTLDEVINNDEGSSSIITDKSAFDIDKTTDEPPLTSTPRRRESSDTSNFQNDASNPTDSEQFEQSPLTYSVLKKTIMAKANEIHSIYQKSQNITPEQRKLMSCGSSLILDLIDKSENNAYKGLFSYVDWNKIVLAFENDLLLPEAKIQESLMTKWECAAGLVLMSNNFEDSQVFLASAFAKQNQSNQRATIKLFISIYDVIQNNPFIMRQEYPDCPINSSCLYTNKHEYHTDNISEGEYTDQIWLPIFKSLFAINGNLIRVKKGETVPTDSTIEKSNFFSANRHITGFKTDIRFIFDYKESEFDIGGAEVCLPYANNTKVTDDEAKLLREGKIIANSLNNVNSGNIHFSWVIQISGLRAYFSTIAYVGHDLHVGVLQNQVVFPSCIGELNDTTKSLIFLKTLFQFRNSIENSAQIILSKITQTNKCNNAISNKFSDSGLVSPPHTMQQPSSQTWYTPPRKVQKNSIFPHYNLQLLKTGTDDVILDSPSLSATDNNKFGTEDSFGIVKVGNRWYHPGLRKYYDNHPLE
ncbi:hypothetical protein G6F56_005454 [Rhizopus delemar]|nr:hypothetical protein G6F56_005454 [Rhizopus delemar]